MKLEFFVLTFETSLVMVDKIYSFSGEPCVC